jgi:2-acylglycerol O-acyltransferase 2
MSRLSVEATTTETESTSDRGLSKNSRTLSASTLKDALSKLAATPLQNPVAALHANIK